MTISPQLGNPGPQLWLGRRKAGAASVAVALSPDVAANRRPLGWRPTETNKAASEAKPVFPAHRPGIDAATLTDVPAAMRGR